MYIAVEHHYIPLHTTISYYWISEVNIYIS